MECIKAEYKDMTLIVKSITETYFQTHTSLAISFICNQFYNAPIYNKISEKGYVCLGYRSRKFIKLCSKVLSGYNFTHVLFAPV